MNPVLQLGDIASVVMGQAPAGKDCNKAGNGYPFVKVGEFSADRPVIREWTTNPLKKAKEGDVLVCVVGATAGKVNLGIDCAIGRSVAAVRPLSQRLGTSYLHHFLKTKTLVLRQGSQGLAQGVITREMLLSIEIPLPPHWRSNGASRRPLTRFRTRLQSMKWLSKLFKSFIMELRHANSCL